MEQPWCKFYPRDWLGDPQLRMCSLAARGLWADMLCLMGTNGNGRRGYLEIGGQAVTAPALLARLVGGDEHEVKSLLAELEVAKVFSTDATGTIFSRRIVKDSAVSEQKRTAGLQGGNPLLLKQPVKQPVKQAGESCLNPYSRSQKPEARGDEAPQFEHLKEGLYIREYEKLLADAHDRLKKIKAKADNHVIDLTTAACELLSKLKKEKPKNWQERIKLLMANPDSYERGELKPKARGEADAWTKRIEDIRNAMAGVREPGGLTT